MGRSTETVTARIPRADRRLLEAAADAEGVSLNQIAGEALRRRALETFLPGKRGERPEEALRREVAG